MSQRVRGPTDRKVAPKTLPNFNERESETSLHCVAVGQNVTTPMQARLHRHVHRARHARRIGMEAGPERLRAGEGQLSCSILLSDGRPAADFSNCSCDTASSPSVFSLSTSSSFPCSTALSRNPFTLFLPYELINLLTSSVSSSRLTASQNITAPKHVSHFVRLFLQVLPQVHVRRVEFHDLLLHLLFLVALRRALLCIARHGILPS